MSEDFLTANRSIKFRIENDIHRTLSVPIGIESLKLFTVQKHNHKKECLHETGRLINLLTGLPLCRHSFECDELVHYLRGKSPDAPLCMECGHCGQEGRGTPEDIVLFHSQSQFQPIGVKFEITKNKKTVGVTVESMSLTNEQIQNLVKGCPDKTFASMIDNLKNKGKYSVAVAVESVKENPSILGLAVLAMEKPKLLKGRNSIETLYEIITNEAARNKELLVDFDDDAGRYRDFYTRAVAIALRFRQGGKEYAVEELMTIDKNNLVRELERELGEINEEANVDFDTLATVLLKNVVILANDEFYLMDSDQEDSYTLTLDVKGICLLGDLRKDQENKVVKGLLKYCQEILFDKKKAWERGSGETYKLCVRGYIRINPTNEVDSDALRDLGFRYIRPRDKKKPTYVSPNEFGNGAKLDLHLGELKEDKEKRKKKERKEARELELYDKERRKLKEKEKKERKREERERERQEAPSVEN